MNLDRILKVRISNGLRQRLDDMARTADRKRSDLAREAVVIGLRHLSRRFPGDEANPPHAA